MSTSTVKTYLPWVVAVALFMEGLDTTIVNTAVPAIAEGLQVAPLAVTSYILSLAKHNKSVEPVGGRGMTLRR
jgi:MFS family permease